MPMTALGPICERLSATLFCWRLRRQMFFGAFGALGFAHAADALKTSLAGAHRRQFFLGAFGALGLAHAADALRTSLAGAHR